MTTYEIRHEGCFAMTDPKDAEIARLTAALEERGAFIKAEADRCGALVDQAIVERDDAMSLFHASDKQMRAAIAERDAARAETAMAFEAAKEAIAKDAEQWDEEVFGDSNSAGETAYYIRNLNITPAHATAALAARDKATREQAWREAHDLIADYPRVAPGESEWRRYDEQIGHSQTIILALIEKEASHD